MLDSAPSTANAPIREGAARPLLVFAFQTEHAANGGLASLSLVLEALRAFAPSVVTQRESAFARRWREAGFDVGLVDVPPPADRWSPAARARALSRRLPAMLAGQLFTRRRVRESGARVVHFNDAASFFYGALGAKAAGAKVVVALRGTTGIERWRWYSVACVADVIVTLSDDMRDRYHAALDARRRAPRPRARLVTIPSIVLPPKERTSRAEARAALGLPEGVVAIGVVGAVRSLKKQAEIVRALGARLGRMGADVRLYFVGDLDPADAYARTCEAARLAVPEPDRIRFVGYTDDVGTWYRALDLVVIGSEAEGLARVMLESMAAGLPVVSTDVCSAREVLEGSGAGAVVPCGDFEGLADAAERLVRDPELRRRLGERGRAAVAERYSPRAIGAAYDALYDALWRDLAIAPSIAST